MYSVDTLFKTSLFKESLEEITPKEEEAINHISNIIAKEINKNIIEKLVCLSKYKRFNRSIHKKPWYIKGK